MDIALLIVRLIIGLGLAAHGAQKLFGLFGGGGIAGTAPFFEKLGFRPGSLFATAAGLGELGGGLLVALGFLGPIGPAMGVMVMLVAIGSVHIGNGFFVSNNGWELNAVYIAGFVAVAFAGFGAYSIDAMVGLSLFAGAAQIWVVLAIGVALALVNLAVRRRATAA
jgi:putative oxidoreductase